LPLDAEGNPLIHHVSINIAQAILLANPSTQLNRCTLGSVEALARTDARSDHAVLDFFVSFCINVARHQV
jgi:hypothetical protein